jgi:inhibitor of KinA sporulation pathway (predicted exonuclease)
MQRFIPAREAIIFDLEGVDINLCLRRNCPIPIWNIGAVLINAVGEIEDTFESYIKVDDLTLITPDLRMYCNFNENDERMINSAPSFQQVYSRFLNFAYKRPIMSWGGYDGLLMTQNIASNDLQDDLRKPYFDCISFIAGVLADSAIKIKSYSLKNCCEFFGIETSPNHRGLQDSICAAKVLNEVLKLQR